MSSRFFNITAIDVTGSPWSKQVFTDTLTKALVVLRERAARGAQAYRTGGSSEDPYTVMDKPLLHAYVWDTEKKHLIQYSHDELLELIG